MGKVTGPLYKSGWPNTMQAALYHNRRRRRGLLEGGAVVDTVTVVNDNFTSDEDSVFNGDVAANDSTTSGGILNYAVVSGVVDGNLVLNANGTFAYTPNSNFSGVDSFVYSAIDSVNSQVKNGSVSITVNAIVDLITVDTSFSVDEDNQLSDDVSTGDSTTSGGTLVYAVVSGVSSGVLNLNSNGAFTYDPTTDYNGPDSFTYSITDADANESSVRTCNITVNPVSDAAIIRSRDFTDLTLNGMTYSNSNVVNGLDFEGLIKQVPANQPFYVGARYVENLILDGETMNSTTLWLLNNASGLASRTDQVGFTETLFEGSVDSLQLLSTNTQMEGGEEYRLSVECRLVSGSPSSPRIRIYDGFSFVGSSTVTMDPTWRRYSTPAGLTAAVLGGAHQLQLRGTNSVPLTLQWRNVQFEKVTGQANDLPASFVHGVVPFATENANTIGANSEVTEAIGPALTTIEGIKLNEDTSVIETGLIIPNSNNIQGTIAFRPEFDSTDIAVSNRTVYELLDAAGNNGFRFYYDAAGVFSLDVLINGSLSTISALSFAFTSGDLVTGIFSKKSNGLSLKLNAAIPVTSASGDQAFSVIPDRDSLGRSVLGTFAGLWVIESALIEVID